VREQPPSPLDAPNAAIPSAQLTPATTSTKPSGNVPSRRFERPVIILSAPRSGSTLLFETLAKAPALFTIGGESHRMFESLPELHPSNRQYDSNRLTAADATPTVTAALLRNFSESLRDRDGRPAPETAVRVLEKTPKNALRLPFLREVFPDARFVLLYREPHEVLASMIEAWQSGRFRMYPDLPGWTGMGWSLLLVPGWRDLIGRPLEEIVARQWATTIDTLLDDLDGVPATQLVSIRYDAFLAQPQAQINRLCERLDLKWDTTLQELPLSRHTLTPPEPNKWRKYEASLARVLPMIAATKARAEQFFNG